MPFRLIATCLASYTTQNLVTEFMPHGMSGKDRFELSAAGYSLEIFTKQLERHFATVEVIEYPFPQTAAPAFFFFAVKKEAKPFG